MIARVPEEDQAHLLVLGVVLVQVVGKQLRDLARLRHVLVPVGGLWGIVRVIGSGSGSGSG